MARRVAVNDYAIHSSRMSDMQKECLINYMEENLLFARHEISKLGRRGHEKYKQMWAELSSRLNEIGPCQKEPKNWEKTWTNLRLIAKNRRAEYMRDMRRTGNVPPKYPLYDFDERIYKIFGAYCVGIPIIAEAGLPGKPACSYLNHGSNNNQKNPDKPTDEQRQHLISFMANNKLFAQQKLDGPTMKTTWIKLTTELNSITGGAMCSNKKWIKVWLLMVERAVTYRNICKSNNMPLDDLNHISILTSL